MKDKFNLQGSIADLQEVLRTGQMLVVTEDDVMLKYGRFILADGKEDVVAKLEVGFEEAS